MSLNKCEDAAWTYLFAEMFIVNIYSGICVKNFP